MPSECTPDVSIITPTHNRSRSVRRLLDALCVQTFPHARFEVVVVADGCTDDTVAMLRAYQAPYMLRIVAQAARGAAEARNVGARNARAPLLIFLDDDVEPTTNCIAAHVRAHTEMPGSVVFGPYPPLPRPTRSLFRLLMRQWWAEKFDHLAAPGHRFTYQDLLTGNLSLRAELWERVGGLDPRFRKSGEDYELGARLMQAGVPFVFAPDALAFHHEHETMSIAAALRRAYNEGRTDVLIGRKHPALRPTLPCVVWRQQSTRRQRALVRLLYLLNGRGDSVARALQHLLPLLDHAGLRLLWRTLYEKLHRYWYTRGVTEELRSGQEWAAYAWEVLPEHTAEPELTLDLCAGIEAAEACLDAVRPMSVSLRYGPHHLGIMPGAPGAEPWRGVHLRPFLLLRIGPVLLQALALEGVIDPGPELDRQQFARSIAAMSAYYGPDGQNAMWSEQYGQWDRLDQQEHYDRGYDRYRDPDPQPAGADRGGDQQHPCQRPGGDPALCRGPERR